MQKLFAVVLLILAPLTGRADDLDDIDALSQAEFGLLADDLAAVLAYKGLQPPEPYGTVGFDVGLETSVVQLSNDAAWERAGADVSTLAVARIVATKGLPLGFDVGAFLATAPRASARAYGAQLRYALVEGGVASPAVGLRLAATRMEGVEQLDYDTRSLDVSVSKGFGPATPYAGYGRVWGHATPGAGTGLLAEDVARNRAFAGVRFSFVLLQFALEAERTGDTTGYSAKLGFGF